MQSAVAQNVLFTPYAQSCVRFKARQLSRRSEFRRCDEDDLRQELWLLLLREAHRFDPRRASLNTFIDRVVTTAAGMIVRRPYRQKRVLNQKAVSLDRVKVLTGDGRQALADSLSDADLSRRTGVTRGDDIARRDAADAFAHTIGAMPDDVRNVCRQVIGGTISSAARELGRSRRQVRKALQAARPYFERAGLDGR
jgi:DNA-directed RNA polymerase specialized sigma24 family protein